MTRPMQKTPPPPNASAALDVMQDLISVVTSQMAELRERFPDQAPVSAAPDVSSKIVLLSCKVALRHAKGLQATPPVRDLINATYDMVCRELEAMP